MATRNPKYRLSRPLKPDYGRKVQDEISGFFTYFDLTVIDQYGNRVKSSDPNSYDIWRDDRTDSNRAQ